MTKWFREFAGSAGLPTALRFHSLRHTGASWLAELGVDLRGGALDVRRVARLVVGLDGRYPSLVERGLL